MSRRGRLDDKTEEQILTTLFQQDDVGDLVERNRDQLRESFQELQLENPNASFEEIMELFIEENPVIFREFTSFVENVFDRTGSFQTSRNQLVKDLTKK